MIPPKPPFDEWEKFENTDDLLKHYRRWGLISKKSDIVPDCFYNGFYTSGSVPCEILGHQNHRTAIIRVGGELHCIDGEYFASLQPKADSSIGGEYTASRQPKADSDYIVFDIETTGLNSNCDQIIEIAAIRYSRAVEADCFESLVKPKCPIPRNVEKLTGISNDDVRDAPALSAVGAQFLEFIGRTPLVGHNVRTFDVPFLQSALSVKFENRIIDTLQLARKCFPGLRSYKLENLKTALELGDAASHRAMADVRTTNALYRKCLERTPETSVENAEEKNAEPNKTRASRFPFAQNRVDVHSIAAQVDSIDRLNPLFEKQIVFTGELSIPRGEAMQLAVNCGAILKTSVSRKTDYLVVGKQDKSLVGEDGLSTKEEKAYDLNKSGKANVQIIREEEFLKLAKGAVAAV